MHDKAEIEGLQRIRSHGERTPRPSPKSGLFQGQEQLHRDWEEKLGEEFDENCFKRIRGVQEQQIHLELELCESSLYLVLEELTDCLVCLEAPP